MKKLMRFSVITVLIFSVVAMTGCDDDNNGNGDDKTALLTAHVWKFDKITTTSTDAEIQLAVTLMSAFLTGSTMHFKSDGTYTMSMMNPFTQQLETDSGTWELNAAGTVITIDKGTEDEGESTIVTLTSDVLEHTMEEEIDEGVTAAVNYRWVK